MIATNDKPDIDWHTQLIETRGRRTGFAGANLDDAVQDITPRVLAFRYDVERSNGASLRTALTAVVDKSLLAIRRRETRYQKCLERARAARPTTVGGEASAYEDSTPLRLDVQTALSQLSELERQICEALSHGFSIREIAIRLGCDWHTVNRRIAGIRARFTELGLDGWLETS